MKQSHRCHPSCGRCRQDFSSNVESEQVPLLLSCGHSLCRQCTKESGATIDIKVGEDQEQVAIKSVECHRGCDQTVLVCNELPIHKSLLREMECTVYTDPITQCEECEKLAAIYWCEICTSSLCSQCFGVVHAPKVMKKHVSVPISERPYPAEQCNIHALPVSQYCLSHSKKMCVSCNPESHANDCSHNILPLQEALDNSVESLKGQFYKLTARRDALRDTLMTLQLKQVSLGPAAAISEEGIKKAMRDLHDKIKKAINERESQLLAECYSVRDTRINSLNDQTSVLLSSLSRVSQTREVVRDLLRSRPEVVMSSQSETASLIGDCNAADKCDLSYEIALGSGVPFSYSSNSIDSLLNRISSYGRVGTSDLPRITATSKHETQQPLPKSSGKVTRISDTKDRGPRLRKMSLAGSRDLLPRRASGPAAPAP